MNNPFNFELDQLFQMAARINKNRSFLFVSKVLGKHLAVNPKIPILIGSLLALRYLEVVHGHKDARTQKIAKAIQTNEGLDEVWTSMKAQPAVLPRPTTFIGFAETATALGHAVFSAFGGHAKYIHTTREQINELSSVINFEEEHSHATSHRVYAQDARFFEDDSEVVLVDDEVTTGKTAINIIRTLKEHYPMKRQFTVVSILDWRTPEYRDHYRRLEEELDIKIHEVSLIDGMVTVSGHPNIEEKAENAPNPFKPEIEYLAVQALIADDHLQHSTSTSANGKQNRSHYLLSTGRFGLSIEQERGCQEVIEKIARYAKQQRKGQRTLVIGTGEFMYVPMQIAARMGAGVAFQSSTRSPIYKTDHPAYTIQKKFTFDSPENEGITNYLYNIHPAQYDEIFILFERMSSLEAAASLIEQLSTTKSPIIRILNMTEILE